MSTTVGDVAHFGRKHFSHKGLSMSTQAVTRQQDQTTSTAHDFTVSGLSALVRQITASLLGARVKVLGHKQSRDPGINSLRANVRNDRNEPVKSLLRLNFTDIDEGVPVAMVNAYLRELIEANEHYAARRERRQAGVLSFRQRIVRLAQRDNIEDCQADNAVLAIDESSDPNELRQAKLEVLETVQPALDIAAAIDARLAEIGA